MDYSKYTFLMIIVISILGVIFSLPVSESDDKNTKNKEWRLNIVHTNDIHGRFEETSGGEAALPCKGHIGGDGTCYGGFPRISTLVKQERERSKALNIPILYLDAGDIFDGSKLFDKYTDKISYRLFNALEPNATTLGNHEFNKGIEKLISYIDNLSFPVVTCNLDLTNEPSVNRPNLHKSIILDVDGHQVGIVGYTYPGARKLGHIEYLPEIEPIKNEVSKFKKQGVRIIIGLSHSGYKFDQHVAEVVDDIDLIVSGHSHSLLSSDAPVGTQILSQIVEGPYPTVINKMENGKNRSVYIVQAYAYTKYLGNLSVVFDDQGEIKSFEGKPILLDDKIKKDPILLEEFDKFPADPINLTVVGYTRVPLEGYMYACRRRECTLGDVVADALIEYNLNKTESNKGWTDAAIALINSGLLADGMSNVRRNPIVQENIDLSITHNNKIYKMELTGKDLRDQFEYSLRQMENYKISEFWGGFLQVSGIRVTYDLSKPVGSRVIPDLFFVRCAECVFPHYEKLIDDKIYKVLMDENLAVGRFNLSHRRSKVNTTLDGEVKDAVRWYINARSPVHPELGDRIHYILPSKNSAYPPSCSGYIYSNLLSCTETDKQLPKFIENASNQSSSEEQVEITNERN
ncbi:protein 5NUC-like [Microplitis mediator]|uniref:protein 5NUC-like n=1 Tax=Microplitis mediator TaxID=375433 RepID=UPI002553942A|nr:protein 5NUC-like [Microplitis mediator]XP_057334353.1 protein 5NUC-like [Microplitis mediator]